MLTHSLKFWNICIFFFPKRWKKKIQLYFFISQEKFTFHSLNFSGGAYIKNKEESYIFSEMPFLTPFYVVFFFSEICIFFPCIFFFLEKFTPHSLTHFKRLYFFISGVGKEKIQCFYSLTRFGQKYHKNQLFQEKKNTVPLSESLRIPNLIFLKIYWDIYQAWTPELLHLSVKIASANSISIIW